MSDEWTSEEIVVATDAYFWMLDEQVAGRKFVKADVRRKVMAELPKRTKGSVEYKFQNISAVLDSYGLEYVQGYLPARKYQQALFRVVSDKIATRQGKHGELKK